MMRNEEVIEKMDETIRDTYEKRVRQDMKKKAELAFEQMETELMAAIKQHPELAGELHDVLERAREKVLADGED